MTMHARIDHAANAAAAGFQLRPTLAFHLQLSGGRGALLAQCPLMGLDLPRKIAVREDEEGKVWISYNDPAWLGRRYNACAKVQSLLRAMSNSFAGIVLEAGGSRCRRAKTVSIELGPQTPAADPQPSFPRRRESISPYGTIG